MHMDPSVTLPSEFYTDAGAIFIGFAVACMFYGCSTVQTFIYYRVSPRDAFWVKASIFVIWLLESAHTVLLTACVFIIVIRDAGNVKVMDSAKWALTAVVYITSVVELAVRALFINRIWKLSKGNRRITAVLCMLSAAVFVSSLLWGIRVHHLDHITDIRSAMPHYIYSTFGLALLTDIVMTGAQCVLLWRNRTGFIASDSIVRRLVMYIMNTGALVCVVTAATLIAFAGSKSLIFIGIYLALPKIFFNSLLASLNIRQLAFADADGEGVHAGHPGLAKAELASSLAVHVETTTMHKTDDGYAMVPRVCRRWRPEKAVWLPPAQRSPAGAATEESVDTHHENSTVWHIGSDMDTEARAP